MFYFETIVILLLIYSIYIYAPSVLNKQHVRTTRMLYTNDNADTYPYANSDNYALSDAMVADDYYLPDVKEPRRRKHYPQPRPRPVNESHIHPDFYANQSSMLYYSGLPTSKAPVDWSSLM